MDKLVKSGVDFRNILYVNFEDERIDIKLNELDLIIKAYAELYPDAKIKDFAATGILMGSPNI